MVSPTVGRRGRVIKETLASRFPGCLPLNHRRLIRLLAGHVRYHQLAQLHQLFYLLLSNVPCRLQSFLAAAST